jgi:hypothetical protein
MRDSLLACSDMLGPQIIDDNAAVHNVVDRQQRYRDDAGISLRRLVTGAGGLAGVPVCVLGAALKA